MELPGELEQIIIELAISRCVLERPSKALGIISSCVRFKEWSYPCLYRSIKLEVLPKALLLIRTLSESPEVASLVHSLAVSSGEKLYVDDDEGDRHEKTIITLVDLCSNMEVFALWTPWSPNADISLNLSNRHRLKRLSFDPPEHIVDVPNLTAFQQITHLDFCCVNSSEWYPFIPSLKCLTHLALMITSFDPSDMDVEELPECLASTTLQICVLFMFYQDHPNPEIYSASELALGLVDPRIVVGLGFGCPVSWPYILRTTEQYLDDFLSLGCGPDFWEEAEGVIASRRCKD